MAEARIFADLKQDHDRQRKLIARLGETQGAGEEHETLFETLRQELQAHAAAEEESLYATMLACPDLREDARHSVSEHKEVDDMLGELVEMGVGAPGWRTKFEEMRDRYLHHIDEEEKQMFPAAAKGLTSEAEERIAKVFENRKPRELERATSEMPGDARE
ncbi:MAG: hemerythrin domain-containing protein [Sphingomonadales bacterium]|nr:hemerythrin domain-containing protein [Sphingomonadales bacterium]